MTMSFEPSDMAVSPEQEWLARVSPFLPADDPHQACLLRALRDDVADVNLVCDCPPAPPCTKECCA